MDFLGLCKRLHLMLRIGEETPGTQPSTVIGQPRNLSEMVEWVRASHDDIIKLRPDWKFMQGRGGIALSTGGRIYTPSAMQVQIPDFGKLMPLVNANYGYVLISADEDATSAESEVVYVPAQNFYGRYDVKPLSAGMPRYFTIRDDGALEFDTIADRDYTVRLHYRKAYRQLAADADEPMFGETYHMAIVEWAIVHYYCAGRDNVRETLIKHDARLRKEMSKLFTEQLPDVTAF